MAESHQVPLFLSKSKKKKTRHRIFTAGRLPSGHLRPPDEPERCVVYVGGRATLPSRSCPYDCRADRWLCADTAGHAIDSAAGHGRTSPPHVSGPHKSEVGVYSAPLARGYTLRRQDGEGMGLQIVVTLGQSHNCEFGSRTE